MAWGDSSPDDAGPDYLLVPSPLPSRTGRTPTGRYGTVVLARATHQLRRLRQASPLLQGPPQAQEEQTSSSNTTNIQEEVGVRCQTYVPTGTGNDRLQSENEALREGLQVRQSPPHERPELVDQPPQPTLVSSRERCALMRLKW